MSKPVVSLLFLVVLVAIIGLMVSQTHATSTVQLGKGLPMASAERPPAMVAIDWATFTVVLAGVVLALLRTRRRIAAGAHQNL